MLQAIAKAERLFINFQKDKMDDSVPEAVPFGRAVPVSDEEKERNSPASKLLREEKLIATAKTLGLSMKGKNSAYAKHVAQKR